MKKGTKADWLAGVIGRSIRREKLSDRTRLPPIKTLAARYGVSYGTVQAALKVLAGKGFVELVDGSGCYVRAPGKPVTGPESEKLVFRSRADEIADDIVTAILGGHYRLGTHLPAQKALRFRYRTSNATLRTALEQVRARNLIHPRGRGFIVGTGEPAPPCRARNRVYVVGTAQQFHMVGNHRVSRDFIRAFENEIDQCGLPGIQVLDTDKHTSAVAEALKDSSTLGFLHLGAGVTGMPGSAEARLQQELNLISASGLPLILLMYNDVKESFPNVHVKTGRNVFLHWTDNVGAGEAIAAHLAARGHRSVAWLTYYATGPWARERLKGLRAGMRAAFAGEPRIRVFGPTRPRPSGYSDALNAAIQRMLIELQREHGLSKLAPSDRFRHEIRRMVGEDRADKHMTAWFAKALADKTRTAWVCSDENLAVAAAEYLRGQGVRIPEDLSLIGINNDEDAFVSRITTYDFLKRHLGYLAAHCILGDIPVRTRRGRFLVCPGQVVERGSVRSLRSGQ